FDRRGCAHHRRQRDSRRHGVDGLAREARTTSHGRRAASARSLCSTLRAERWAVSQRAARRVTVKSPRFLIAAGVAIAVATAVGAAFAPWLLVHHPFWLLALNPWPRHQLLVAPNAELLPFVSIVLVRGM